MTRCPARGIFWCPRIDGVGQSRPGLEFLFVQLSLEEAAAHQCTYFGPAEASTPRRPAILRATVESNGQGAHGSADSVVVAGEIVRHFSNRASDASSRFNPTT
jgi:hypothetical protein